MLESLVIMILAIGFVSFILAIYERSIVFAGVSLFMNIILLAAQVYIEVPTAGSFYNEPVLIPVALGFIFINIIWMILCWFDIEFEDSIP